MGSPKITHVSVTPIAVLDPPLLNASGVHEPYQLRAIVELGTDAGLSGLAETHGDEQTLAGLRAAAPALAGVEIFDLNELNRRVAHEQAYGAFEVACYDAQGKATDLRVCELLGGAVRESVPYSAGLYYRWDQHPEHAVPDDYPPDDWGAALAPDAIVAQARRMADTYGFRSFKLNGGVFEPEAEADAVAALRDAFPDAALRLDLGANWTVATSLRLAPRLEGLLEYLQDPTDGNPGMAEVARKTSLPLATDLSVTSFDQIPEAAALGSVSDVLCDHHSWGGLRAAQRLAGICETFDWGLSLRSDAHLGISLAAMTHLAAATPNLTYACDTPSPWQREDVIEPGALTWSNGSLTVPAGPGLGVELDRDALARLHEQYLACGLRTRDDEAAMLRADPTWPTRRPRF